MMWARRLIGMGRRVRVRRRRELAHALRVVRDADPGRRRDGAVLSVLRRAQADGGLVDRLRLAEGRRQVSQPCGTHEKKGASG